MNDFDKEKLDRLTTGNFGEDFVRDMELRTSKEEPELPFDSKQFHKDLEQIFKNIPSTKPKQVMCGRCGVIVEIVPGNDCKCGYIQKIATKILKSIENNETIPEIMERVYG